MDLATDALESLGSRLWDDVQKCFSFSKLERIEVFLDVVRGKQKPPDSGPLREFHNRLYFPGLSTRPWWDPRLFPLSKTWESKFELILDEGISLLSKPWLFLNHPGRYGVNNTANPSSPIEGLWLGFYLQRHLRRLREAAEQVPVTLRTLDLIPASREALFSFLGPNSCIKTHSDKVNFVITLYLPLFSDGGWIDFGGEARRWVSGSCMAADSTYFHQSVNPTCYWRGLLLADHWHPELTDVEKSVLSIVVPQVNDVLRVLGGNQ